MPHKLVCAAPFAAQTQRRSAPAQREHGRGPSIPHRERGCAATCCAYCNLLRARGSSRKHREIMEQTTTHPLFTTCCAHPPPRRRWRDGRATGSAQRACGVRIARHRRTGSDMQLACQAAPTRSLAAGVRTGEGVNRYFPATIENRRPREQPRLETEFVCASERRRLRGGDWYAPPRGRDVGDRGPTRGQRAGGEAALGGPLSRAAQMFG